jgi:hypothetical protein
MDPFSDPSYLAAGFEPQLLFFCLTQADPVHRLTSLNKAWKARY